MTAERIHKLQQNNNAQYKHNTHPEARTIRVIKTKLRDSETMIAQADKGNSLVILPIQQYDSKIQDFIQANNFQDTTKDPTKNFQSQIRKAISNSKTLIPRETKWKYVNMNPSAPSIKGLIKIHKPDQPIRPVVNWQRAPAYKLARLFTQKIRQLAPLPEVYNVDNTVDLISKLKDTPILPQFALASLDITNLYTNIPVTETRDISNTLKQDLLDPQTQHELMDWYDVITRQTYFTNNEKILVQKEGLAMGAPSSGLIAVFFLQHLEHHHLPHLSTKHRVINCFWYVDDILLIYDANHTDIHSILNDFNAIHQKMRFTAETETDKKLNYLDITIHRTPQSWKTSIYRKPTFTDSIIPYTANHPTQHKYAAVRFLYNRLNTYDLQDDEYKTEENTIHNILYNNSFPIHSHKPPTQNPPSYTPSRQPVTTQTPTWKWTIFTYIGKETTFITNIFRKTNLKIVFRTSNTVQRLLMHRHRTSDTYAHSGVYKLTCPDCNKAYVGQTGRNFTARFNQHKNAFRTNSHSSRFAQHLLEQKNSFGTVHNTKQVLQRQNKGAHLNTIDRFHIYSEYTNDNHLNDNQTIFPNKIFDAVLNPHQP
jgi:hypothetical protein